MVDITINENGKLQRLKSVEQKARNLLNTSLGSMLYYPNFGFDFKEYLEGKEEINVYNFQTELNHYLYQNNISTFTKNFNVKDFILNFELNVEQGGYYAV